MKTKRTVGKIYQSPPPAIRIQILSSGRGGGGVSQPHNKQAQNGTRFAEQLNRGGVIMFVSYPTNASFFTCYVEHFLSTVGGPGTSPRMKSMLGNMRLVVQKGFFVRDSNG